MNNMRMIYAIALLVGAVISFSGCDDALSEFGQNKTFVKYFGDARNNIGMHAIGSENGYLVTGITEQVRTGGIFSKDADALIVRTDINGNQIWEVKVANTLLNGSEAVQLNDTARYIQQRNNGQIFIVGDYSPVGSSGIINSNIFLARVNADGSNLVTRDFKLPLNQYASKFKFTTDNGLIIIGTSEDTVKKDGSTEMMVMKLNNNLQIEWLKFYGFDSERNDYGEAIVETADKDFIWMAYSQNTGTTEMRLVKSNNVGNIVWDYRYGSGLTFQEGFDVVSTTGGYVMAGSVREINTANKDILLTKTDTDGNLIFKSKIGGGGNDIAYSIKNMPNGNLALAGASASSAESNGGTDMYVAQTDINGNLLWNRYFGFAGNDVANSIEVLSDNTLLVCGTVSLGSNTMIALIKITENGEIDKK